MAALALFIALGGTSFAAVKSSDGEVASVAKKKKPKAKRGPAGPQGAAGPQGPAGAAGAPGTARAYALVPAASCAAPPTGTCAFSKSKGVSVVTHISTGFFCVTAPGISAEDTPAAITVDFVSTADPESLAEAGLSGIPAIGCPDSDFVVITARPTAFNADVYVDDVGFFIVIP